MDWSNVQSLIRDSKSQIEVSSLLKPEAAAILDVQHAAPSTSTDEAPAVHRLYQHTEGSREVLRVAYQRENVHLEPKPAHSTLSSDVYIDAMELFPHHFLLPPDIPPPSFPEGKKQPITGDLPINIQVIKSIREGVWSDDLVSTINGYLGSEWNNLASQMRGLVTCDDTLKILDVCHTTACADAILEHIVPILSQTFSDGQPMTTNYRLLMEQLLKKVQLCSLSDTQFEIGLGLLELGHETVETIKEFRKKM